MHQCISAHRCASLSLLYAHQCGAAQVEPQVDNTVRALYTTHTGVKLGLTIANKPRYISVFLCKVSSSA